MTLFDAAQLPDLIDWQQPVNRQHPLNRDLAGWWRVVAGFSGFGSVRFLDWTRSNHGTLTNMSLDARWKGSNPPGGNGHLGWDGSNDYVNLGSGLNNTGQLSIFAWLRLDTVAAGVRSLFSNSNSAGNAVDYVFEVNRTAGRLSFLRNAAFVTLTSSTGLSTNTWYHVGVTVSGTTSNWDITLWLNGKSDGNTTTSQNPNGGTKGTSIGRLGEFNGHYFSGRMADVRYYTRGLTAAEVADLYQESRSGYPLAINRVNPYRFWSPSSVNPLVNAGLVNRGLVNAGLVG